MEQLVNYETAILAKELGFDIPVQNRFFKNGSLNGKAERRFGGISNWNHECFQDEYRKYISVPTQSELKDWLYKKYGIIAEGNYNAMYNYFTSSIYYIYENNRTILEQPHSTPQLALEKSLFTALVRKVEVN